MAKSSKREKITVNCVGVGKRRFEKGIVVKDVVVRLGDKLPHAPLMVSVDNILHDLDYSLAKDCVLDFYDLGRRDGLFCYQRSISYVLAMAVEELFPDAELHIKHSLSKGFFCELVFSPSENIRIGHIEAIKNRMQEIIDADISFVRKEMRLDKAIALFERMRRSDKSRVLKHEKDKRVGVYFCADARNHFYGFLAPSTGCLKHFDLRFYPPGFILHFPERQNPDNLPAFVEQPKMFQVFKEYSDWLTILGVRTVGDLNEITKNGEMVDFIRISEAIQEKNLAFIADDLKSKIVKPRIILISGPSSSGKTTFSKRLSIQLKVNGERPVVMNLDDYFHDREHTPKDEFGNYDFEAFEAIDYRLFQQHLMDLINGKEAVLPRFDFKTGTRCAGESMKIDDDQVIIVEGIHGLNKRLTESLPEIMKYKIYVSALTMLNIDRQNRIPTTDVRLIRRMVRDNQFRSADALLTIKRWQMVRRGEDEYIFPYQERADVMFNSALVYELAVLKPFAMPMLKKITPRYPEHVEATRLIKFLSYFRDVSAEHLPRTSILREFIGGSVFKY